MFFIPTLDGPSSDIVNSLFRKINFDDSDAVIIVSTGLRHAWVVPHGEYTLDANGVGYFMRADQQRSDADRDALQRADKEDVRSPWREAIYYQWNHVFYDVANYLVEECGEFNRFHPPNSDAFAIKYPRSDGEDSEEVVVKTWEANVLLIPAYLDPGVSLRMSMRKEGESGPDGAAENLGTFDGSNTTEIWYLRRGVQVAFHIEGDFPKAERKGVAAVLTVGIMCSASHGKLHVPDVSKEALQAGDQHPTIQELSNRAAESFDQMFAEISSGAKSSVSVPLFKPRVGDVDRKAEDGDWTKNAEEMGK